MKKTILCDLLGIEFPIIQAAMTWVTSAEMVAAVSEAGGLGTLGPNAGATTITTSITETSERVREQIQKVRSLTKRPFAVNLVIPSPKAPPQSREFSDGFFRVIIEERVPVAVTVGPDPALYTGGLKQAGVKVLHRALPVNVEAAKKAAETGVDALVAVGVDGGGHTGIDAIPTFCLVPQIVDAVKIPVIAGGGIVDGRGLAAALAMGAAGVYMGTRFIASAECPAHPMAKQALLGTTDTGTVTLATEVGILRAQRNPLIQRCLDMAARGATPLEIYSVERRGIKTGLLDGDLVNGNLTWGAAVGMIKDVKSVGAIMHDILSEADEILRKLS